METTKIDNWYNDIDELVLKFQSGDESAGEELLKALAPYLIKYSRLLQDGHVNLKDRDTRKFLSLFIADFETRRCLGKAYQSAEVRNQAYKVASMISQACSYMGPEDIDQEMAAILLTLARRWKKQGKKKNFCGYMYNAFRYELHRSVSPTLRNPLNNKAEAVIRFDDDEYISSGDLIVDNIIPSDTLVMIMEEELDNSWIRGITCGDLFTELTPLQRLILRDFYYEGLTDQKIADKTGMHIQTIRKHRRRAVSIINEQYRTKED